MPTAHPSITLRCDIYTEILFIIKYSLRHINTNCYYTMKAYNTKKSQI